MKISQAEHHDLVTLLRDSGCVFAEDEAASLLSASSTYDELSFMVRRRVAGEPLEYVLGWAEFCGMRIAVEPGVFVPRRRSECLVQQAISVARPSGNVVVDLCCGSGAIGVAIVNALDNSALHAVDIEPSAVRCALRNVGQLGHVLQGDLYRPLPGELMGCVQILVANAPYVPSAAIVMMPQEARVYEPAVALDGGIDGLDVQRRVISEAPHWLAPGGTLLIETSQRQSAKTAELFANQGLATRIVHSDELEATVVMGTKSTTLHP